MADREFDGLSDLEVFARWREVMEELKARELIPTTNSNPLGGYAEVLVARAYNTQPLTGRDEGFDVVRPDTGARVQVKGRRASQRPSTHFSDFRDLEGRRFDEFVGVVFNEDFSVDRAWQMPWETVCRLARPVDGKSRLYIGHVEAAAADGDETVQRLDL